MQMAITCMAVVAGMVFSLSAALLAEELIFGQVFRLFFARQTATAKPGQKRSGGAKDVLRNMTAANATGQTGQTKQAKDQR